MFYALNLDIPQILHGRREKEDLYPYLVELVCLENQTSLALGECLSHLIRALYRMRSECFRR